jgi:hypothetical protein
MVAARRDRRAARGPGRGRAAGGVAAQRAQASPAPARAGERAAARAGQGRGRRTVPHRSPASTPGHGPRAPPDHRPGLLFAVRDRPPAGLSAARERAVSSEATLESPHAGRAAPARSRASRPVAGPAPGRHERHGAGGLHRGADGDGRGAARRAAGAGGPRRWPRAGADRRAARARGAGCGRGVLLPCSRRTARHAQCGSSSDEAA